MLQFVPKREPVVLIYDAPLPSHDSIVFKNFLKDNCLQEIHAEPGAIQAQATGTHSIQPTYIVRRTAYGSDLVHVWNTTLSDLVVVAFVAGSDVGTFFYCKRTERWFSTTNFVEQMYATPEDCTSWQSVCRLVFNHTKSLLILKNLAYGNSFELADELLDLAYSRLGKDREKNKDGLLRRVFDKIIRIIQNNDPFGEWPEQDVMGYFALEVISLVRKGLKEKSAETP